MKSKEPTGYGKRLNQLTVDELKWWNENRFRPTDGVAYLCRRGSKEHGTKAGKVYVYQDGDLHHTSSRFETVLLGGYNTLCQPYAFEEVGEPCDECPMPQRCFGRD
jgi:hypothetical protein